VKAVFDTDVLVAALITEGLCGRLLIRGRKRQFELILCPHILKEFQKILTSKFSLSRSETGEALALVSEAASSIVHPVERVSGICRDPSDDKVLTCALAAKSDYLVSGDADLLELKTFRGIKIVKPKEFEMLFVD
jgi:putative PIN family toxin of toxin-antitoxin system